MNESSGWPIEVLERYGKPCIGSVYTIKSKDDVNAYKRDSRATCVVCGQIATDTHHWPEKSQSFLGCWCMRTPKGWFVLKPALFALCRNCHEGFHNRTLTANWVWDSEEARERWWAGEYRPAHAYITHSKDLYMNGHWEFIDLARNRGFTYKEVRDENGLWKAVRGKIR